MSNLQTLSEQIPGLNIWKKDIASTYKDMNKIGKEFFGFKSNATIGGLCDYDLPCGAANFSETFRKHDRTVLESRKTLKLLEIQPFAKNEWKVVITTKNPTYDQNSTIDGTIGYCIDVTDILGKLSYLLTRRTFHFQNNSLVQSSFILEGDFSPIKLTERQTECLFFLMRAKSAKEIAKILMLSPRTIETHIEQLKIKFSSQNKSQLLEKAINDGFMNVIPKRLLRQSSEILL